MGSMHHPTAMMMMANSTGMDHGGHMNSTGMDHGGHMNSTGMDHSGHMNSTGMDHGHHMNSTGMDHGHHMNSTGMDHGGHDDHGGMDHGTMMHMFFYFGIENVIVLFQGWTINTVGEMVGSCFGVFFLAMLYEGLKVLREHLLRTKQCRTRQDSRTDYQNGVPLVDSTATVAPQKSTIFSWWHLLQTFLHFIQVAVSYALMLIFMTYNGYLGISILLGAAVGYFVFGWKKAVVVDINEHCH